MSQPEKSTDPWSAQKYRGAASFVHKLTTTVLRYLDPQPTDRILDIGCGDGPLTSQLASQVPQGSVHGLDSSPNFIKHAQQVYGSSGGGSGSYSNLSFELQDCSRLHADGWASAHTAQFDKVFSNAALHWILRDPGCRAPTLAAVYDVLKPGGTFVFEMGGAGNVGEVHAALIGGLVHAGLPVAEAREASPWFFPSDVLMGRMLRAAGFEVDKVELEYRPTKMEEGEAGGIEGWLRLMGAAMLGKVEEGPKRDAVVREICEVLKRICTRDEGGEWIGYVRCRAIARKPESS